MAETPLMAEEVGDRRSADDLRALAAECLVWRAYDAVGDDFPTRSEVEAVMKRTDGTGALGRSGVSLKDAIGIARAALAGKKGGGA